MPRHQNTKMHANNMPNVMHTQLIFNLYEHEHRHEYGQENIDTPKNSKPIILTLQKLS